MRIISIMCLTLTLYACGSNTDEAVDPVDLPTTIDTETKKEELDVRGSDDLAVAQRVASEIKQEQLERDLKAKDQQINNEIAARQAAELTVSELNGQLTRYDDRLMALEKKPELVSQPAIVNHPTLVDQPDLLSQSGATYQSGNTLTNGMPQQPEQQFSPEQARSFVTNQQNMALPIQTYANTLFGFQNNQPIINNNNWFTQLSTDYNHLNSNCSNFQADCPLTNYQMFHQSGSQLGATLFDRFYQENPRSLVCNGQFNDYFGGFVSGGWLNEVQVVIDISIYFQGRMIDQIQYNENNYAPVIIYQLMEGFKVRYNAIIEANSCHQAPVIPSCRANQACNLPTITYPQCSSQAFYYQPVRCQNQNCRRTAQRRRHHRNRTEQTDRYSFPQDNMNDAQSMFDGIGFMYGGRR